MNSLLHLRMRAIGALALSVSLSILLLALATVSLRDARGAATGASLALALGQAHDAAIAAIARIDAYVDKFQRWPASLEDTGFAMPEGGPVAHMALPAVAGKPMTVTLKPPYAAYAIDYVRVSAPGDEAAWSCAGTLNIPDDALPDDCRPEADPEAD